MGAVGAKVPPGRLDTNVLGVVVAVDQDEPHAVELDVTGQTAHREHRVRRRLWRDAAVQEWLEAQLPALERVALKEAGRPLSEAGLSYATVVECGEAAEVIAGNAPSSPMRRVAASASTKTQRPS